MDLCIYHNHCNDGFAATLAVYLKYDRAYGDNVEYIPAQYGDSPPDVTGKQVIIVDFSYPRDTLIDMYEKADSLWVIDHHKTAEEDLKGLDFCIFDLKQSGCYLTWQELFPTTPVPELFLYVQDRDLWQWKLPNSKAINAALKSTPLTFDDWLPFVDDWSTYRPLLETIGQNILDYQQFCISDSSRNSFLIEIDGYVVPCVNTNHLVSETVGRLAEDQLFAVGYFDTDGKRVFNLRSNEKGLDVSVIARNHGGGGHARAAGFTMPLSGIAFEALTKENTSGGA